MISVIVTVNKTEKEMKPKKRKNHTRFGLLSTELDIEKKIPIAEKKENAAIKITGYFLKLFLFKK
tara:strand:+ start:277 stop:471 length:195 start_codon:yes stop_codon:yes gene_type:complete